MDCFRSVINYVVVINTYKGKNTDIPVNEMVFLIFLHHYKPALFIYAVIPSFKKIGHHQIGKDQRTNHM